MPKLSFRLSLRAANSLATATRQSLSILFVSVQYFQITKPCLCVKCQIWVTKVKKKKKLNHPKKWPTTCAVPVMHLRLTFVAFHRLVILRFPINCTINCCIMDSFIAKCFLLLKETGNFKFKGFFVLVAMDPNIRELIAVVIKQRLRRRQREMTGKKAIGRFTVGTKVQV